MKNRETEELSKVGSNLYNVALFIDYENVYLKQSVAFPMNR